MADRFPLILNTSASQIQEIASGDQLDLTGNNIANAGIVTATAFHGDGSNLTGITQTTINSNTNNYLVTGTGTANTLQGEQNLTFNGTDLAISEGGTLKIGTSANLELTSVSGNKARIQSQQEDLYIETSAAKSIILKTNRTGTYAGWTIETDGDLVPSGNKTVDIGSSSSKVDHAYLADAHVENIVITSNIMRTSTGGDIGSSSYKFDNVHATNFHGSSANISGNLSVGGVLTYEDVTNIDSIGIITARSDIKVGSGVTITPAGAGFYAGIVTAANFVKVDGSSLGGVASDSQENTLAGTNAGDAIQQYGQRNCFFGFDAGTDLTTGSDSIFIGHRAGEDITTADHNTIIGSLSGERLTDQHKNTFVGSGAGMEVTSHNNIYIGYYSGKNHGSGDGMCIGIGNECNYYNGGRIANIAIGHRALYGNFSFQKEFNIALGHHALYTSRGDYNLGIGVSVGGGSADPNITGTRNTLIGTYAGQNLTSGSDNTIIGDRAGDLIDAGTNCIIIGHDADASSNGVLNEITLGDTNISKFRIPGINFEINQEKVTTTGLHTKRQLKEDVNIVSGKLSDNVNIATYNGNVYHFTTQETTTSTPNICYQSGGVLSFNSNVDIGETVSVTIITTAAAAAYSANLNIDGNSQTVNWVGGSAPSAGGSSGVDIYTYNIIKTANQTYTVIGNLTKTS